ncbi:GntR family transcriptional regulator [Allorhizobium sp. BGMRC 0089]|uniref:GntR family transcriptional regulator n=1 Tax=Allorhizobium sonneratiae TaxID=2934936 RepID=UPI0020334F86|nr:GntR family transcriptional regulator [Allorhizobium sonneratiae]MCM2292737.1 GntR family transcriptional regulator [Allorhizobium sonneratiae]
MTQDLEGLPLSERLAARLRDKLIAGELKPGQKLSEAAMSAHLDVSRNSLREAFRLLTKDGLLRHEANRGVFVATPSMASIIDLYRVRKVVECKALEQAYPHHPAVKQMQMAVDKALACLAGEDWQGVGSANMRFHAAIVDLADSSRLADFYARIAAELRLSFGLLADPELLHAPFVPLNQEILALVFAGRAGEAATMLDAYLQRSERMVLAAFARKGEPA